LQQPVQHGDLAGHAAVCVPDGDGADPAGAGSSQHGDLAEPATPISVAPDVQHHLNSLSWVAEY
jgi:hypothetical protein